ncbi:MAG: copper homeostasis protein CutC [Bacteroidetes bacterium]|nr:copper homeostasis protein CutC [Bacteroidota bacterium]
MKSLLEIAVFSSDAALIADQAGADRIELCSGYADGGLTPSLGTIRFVKENVSCPISVMIRPRGGDFCYSQSEIEVMKRDIEICKEIGVNGIVFGILDKNFNINKETSLLLSKLASPLEVTFHRAFDICHDPMESLEILIACGVKRILTSGQKSSALEGAEFISELNAKANERISIMPGAGINPGNISEILKQTACKEFHASAKRLATHADSFGFGEHVLPHPEIIAALKERLS